MPRKIFQQIPIIGTQPDRCIDCPLLGAIPKDERQKGDRTRFICMASVRDRRGPFKISTRGANVSKAHKARPESKNRLHRFCDKHWDRWAANQKFPVLYEEVFCKYQRGVEEQRQLFTKP